MFNPFAEFEERFLPLFKQKGVKAFIKQTYNRGKNLLEERPIPSYLLIHTDDIGLGQDHFDAIKDDPDRHFFDITQPEQLEAVRAMLHRKEARFYTLLLTKDAHQRAQQLLRNKVRWYVDHNTNWKPRSYEEVVFSLDVIFGQLYVKLKYQSREIKLAIEELENLRPEMVQ